MKETTMQLQSLYESLGCLFYSIAASNKKIHDAEIKTLLKDVREKWMPLEDSTDDFGMDSANFISISFDYLVEEKLTAEEAWEQFQKFYLSNKEMFSRRIKKTINQTAEDIAQAYAGVNKSEMNRLNALQRLLTK